MKTLICHCNQCRLTRQHTHVKKTNRIQTKQVRAARGRVRRKLHESIRTGEFDMIDELPEKVSVDYYA